MVADIKGGGGFTASLCLEWDQYCSEYRGREFYQINHTWGKNGWIITVNWQLNNAWRKNGWIIDCKLTILGNMILAYNYYDSLKFFLFTKLKSVFS